MERVNIKILTGIRSLRLRASLRNFYIEVHSGVLIVKQSSYWRVKSITLSKRTIGIVN